MLAFLMTAIGLGFDFSGFSFLGLSSDGLRLMILIAFGTFFILTGWREVDAFLQPHPRVEYAGLFPTSIRRLEYRVKYGTYEVHDGYFVRLVFQNKAKNPSGQQSTAQDLAARITVFQNGQQIDAWDGRWANSDRPTTTGDITRLNGFELKANGQEAILDIGFRFHGEKDFWGFDNLHYLEQSPSRIPIKPSVYILKATLGASNWQKRTWSFALNIPDEAQSDDIRQVQIEPIKKPAFRKGGSQT